MHVQARSAALRVPAGKLEQERRTTVLHALTSVSSCGPSLFAADPYQLDRPRSCRPRRTRLVVDLDGNVDFPLVGAATMPIVAVKMPQTSRSVQTGTSFILYLRKPGRADLEMYQGWQSVP